MPEFGSFEEMQAYGKSAPEPFVTPVDPVPSIGVPIMGAIPKFQLPDFKLPFAKKTETPNDTGGLNYLNSMFNYEDHIGQATPDKTSTEVIQEMADNSLIGDIGGYALRGVILLGAIMIIGLGLFFLFKEQFIGLAKKA